MQNQTSLDIYLTALEAVSSVTVNHCCPTDSILLEISNEFGTAEQHSFWELTSSIIFTAQCYNQIFLSEN